MTRAEKTFREAHDDLVGIVQQCFFLLRTLKHAPAEAMYEWTPPHPPSLISPTLPSAPSGAEGSRTQGNLTHAPILANYFQLLCLRAEDILRYLSPRENPWELSAELPPPPQFFENLDFKDFLRVHTAVVWEINSTRNAWGHSGGKKSEEYLYRMNHKFPKLYEEVALLPNFFFIERLRSRLNIPTGGLLAIDADYLMMVQIFLLDRIALKSGFYLERWSR